MSEETGKGRVVAEITATLAARLPEVEGKTPLTARLSALAAVAVGEIRLADDLYDRANLLTGLFRDMVADLFVNPNVEAAEALADLADRWGRSRDEC